MGTTTFALEEPVKCFTSLSRVFGDYTSVVDEWVI